MELIKWTTRYLGQKGFTQPRLEAEILLAQVLELNRVGLYLNFEQIVSASQLARFKAKIKRRAAFEPVAYIMGEKEFYGLKFQVGPEVLIPRPETELLVDEALAWAKKLPTPDLKIADIGAGSGAIGASLLSNLPQAQLWTVDISPQALKTAAANLDALELSSRASLFLGHLLEPLAGRKFHLICANLPYIPESEMAALMPDVGQYEPHLALDGGPDGLSLIEPLVKEAPRHLMAGGALFLEIWPASWPKLNLLAGQAGFANRQIREDLAGHNRLAILSVK